MVIPPVTTVVFAVNLAILFLLTRLPFLETRVLGMLLGGSGGVSGRDVLLVAEQFCTLGTVHWSACPPGVLGQVAKDAAENWGSSLSDQSGFVAALSRTTARYMTFVEFAVLDILSLAIVIVGGWLEHRYRTSNGRRAATTNQTGFSDLRCNAPSISTASHPILRAENGQMQIRLKVSIRSLMVWISCWRSSLRFSRACGRSL